MKCNNVSVTCARAENIYCNSLGAAQWFLAARRCQDDVLGVVRYQWDKPETEAVANAIRNDFTSNRVYSGGLTLKEVPIIDGRAKFVGTTVQFGSHSMFATSLNRNWTGLLENGKQTVPCFHSWHSFADRAVKRGAVIGALRRIQRQCTFGASMVEEAMKLSYELRSIEYPSSFFVDVLNDMHNSGEHRRTPTTREEAQSTQIPKQRREKRERESREEIWQIIRTAIDSILTLSSKSTSGPTLADSLSVKTIAHDC